MRLQAVLPKTLLLIMCFITLQKEAFGTVASIGLGKNLAKLHGFLWGNSKAESKNLFANLVNLVKIPRGEANKQIFGLTIKGIVASDVNRFSVEMIDLDSNIGFHISLRFLEKTTIFNSYEKEGKTYHSVGRRAIVSKKTGGWGEEEKYEELAIEPGNEFEIIISITDEESFEIEINGNLYWYKFRTPIENLIFLRIEGDVTIISVTWNGLTDQ